jgi:threonine dehydrogenase-like Zn-dependent dehydrogenase
LTVQLLKAAGTSQIIVTGTSVDKRRFEIAEQMGADAIINVDNEAPIKRTREIAGRLDCVFEATGVPHTISQGLRLVKNGGKVVVIGIHSGDASFDPIDLVRRRKSLIGAYAFDKDTWKRALALMSTGRIDIAPIITHHLPLSRGEEGFKLAASRKAAKVLFVPQG